MNENTTYLSPRIFVNPDMVVMPFNKDFDINLPKALIR